MLNLPLNVELQKKFDFMFKEPHPLMGQFTWLHDGSVYSVVPERRGNNHYWYMRKMVDGEKRKIYVAPAGKLSAELLDNACIQIAAAASPVQPSQV
jgi:hypothetical protein